MTLNIVAQGNVVTQFRVETNDLVSGQVHFKGFLDFSFFKENRALVKERIWLVLWEVVSDFLASDHIVELVLDCSLQTRDLVD